MMKANELLPVHCPGCGASIRKKQSSKNIRVYTCGSVRDRETQRVLKPCPVANQGRLFDGYNK